MGFSVYFSQKSQENTFNTTFTFTRVQRPVTSQKIEFYWRCFPVTHKVWLFSRTTAVDSF